MSDTNSTAPNPSDKETPPSNECTDCTEEFCLEFTVVDFWGDPVNPPSQYTVDGKSASPDSKVSPLKAGKHLLKAVDGQELKEEIAKRPYEPKKAKPSPARQKAKKEGKEYYWDEKIRLWEGLPLLAGCTNSQKPPCNCYKHLIEVEGGVDYCLVMAFLDHHSGGFHGSGHAGALFIDGKTGEGHYTDITRKALDANDKKSPELGIINLQKLEGICVGADLKLEEIALGRMFNYINGEFSYGIKETQHKCGVDKVLLNGPAHEKKKSDFAINGLIAWAAYALPRGAYIKMLDYATNTKAEVDEARQKKKNEYDTASFNCLTYALAVLDKGMAEERSPGKSYNMDHPNSHIEGYMKGAHDSGVFDDRKWQGEPDAVSKEKRDKGEPGVRHHYRVEWDFSFKGLDVPRKHQVSK